MLNYKNVLLAVCPHGKPEIIDGFAMSLPKATLVAELNTERRLGAFIGQLAQESDGLKALVEYASGKEYEGHRNLGNTQPGDGVRFKGRGLPMLTGRHNYKEAGDDLGVDLVNHPEKVATWPLAAEVGAWFWKTRDCNAAADIANETTAIYYVTERINGGHNGLASRTTYTKRAWAALKDTKGALVATAAEETKKAKIKAAQATSAATASAGGAAATLHPATQHTVGLPTVVLIAVACAALAGLGVYLATSIRKHQDAADTLTAAARTA